MNKPAAVLVFLLASTVGVSGAEPEPDPVTIEAAVSKALGVDPGQQQFVKVIENGRIRELVVDRNKFTSQTGINFLSRYLPESIRLKLKHVDGVWAVEPTNYDSYSAATNPNDPEQGTTSARNYSIRGELLDGLLGNARLQVDLSDLKYRSLDSTRETDTRSVLLTFRKNQRLFGPSTIQFGWKGDDFTETVSINGKRMSRRHAGGYHYNLLIGSTDLSQILSDLWNGKSIQEVTIGEDGAPITNVLAKAKAIELNYTASNIENEGNPLSYSIGGFSLKYQSRMCGGCEGRFDIGLDRIAIFNGEEFSLMNSILPAHSYASGSVKGIDFGSLIASKDAFINPFDGALFSYPNLNRLNSFVIPDFKFSAYDETMDMSGNGFLEVKYDGKYSVSGKITMKLKKGAEKIDFFLSQASAGKRFSAIDNFIKSAFLAGAKAADGSVGFTVEIRDNSMTINGTEITATSPRQ